MPISIDYNTRVVTVLFNSPELLTFVGGNVYDLDTNALRLALNAEAATVAGMAYPDNNRHNTTVLLAGVEYARIIEVINGFSLTFEEQLSPYVVNFVGSNNNYLDVTNLGTVQLRSNNSAGLINVREIQQDIFNNRVTIDAINGIAGTQYPAGTPLQPVDNVPDANIIDSVRGFGTFQIVGDFTFTSGDNIENKLVLGQNASRTTLTIEPAALTQGVEIQEAFVTGTLDGGTIIRNSVIQNLDYINGFVFQCLIAPGFINLGGSEVANFLNCFSGQPGQGSPIFDCNGLTNTESTPLGVRGYNGGIEIRGLDSGAHCSLDFVAGQCKIDLTSCNDGVIVVRGSAKCVDAATGEDLPTGVYNSNLQIFNETVQASQLQETWRRLGLDPNNPVTSFPDGTIDVDGIDIIAVTNGDGSITQTRQ